MCAKKFLYNYSAFGINGVIRCNSSNYLYLSVYMQINCYKRLGGLQRNYHCRIFKSRLLLVYDKRAEEECRVQNHVGLFNVEILSF